MIDPVLLYGDALEQMDQLPESSIDAVVTDPPYGLSAEPDIAEVLGHWLAGDRYEHGSAGFMGKTWDSFVPGPEYWRAARRVLKPGGMLLAFSSSRTSDLLSIAIRMAGFEIRDSLYWLHGQGFPKNLDISTALDKAAGAERAVTGLRVRADGTVRPNMGSWDAAGGYHKIHTDPGQAALATAPATAAARQWDGWGTALKPACEPIIVARAPLAESTVAANVLRYGTGGINIAACRVSGTTRQWTEPRGGLFHPDNGAESDLSASTLGRWPPNVLLTHSAACRPAGTRRVRGSHGNPATPRIRHKNYNGYDGGWGATESLGYEDADGYETVPASECAPDCPVRLLDAQSGELSSGGKPPGIYHNSGRSSGIMGESVPRVTTNDYAPSSGGASRFYPIFWPDPAETFLYSAKAATGERTHGGRVANRHPTVKPRALCRWLLRLVVPPGGTFLDPFMGTGPFLLEGRLLGLAGIGIDNWPEAYFTARARVLVTFPDLVLPDPPESARAAPEAPEVRPDPDPDPPPRQLSMFGGLG